MRFGSPAQTFGKPTDTDRSRSLKGEAYEFTGFVEVDGGDGGAAPGAAAASGPAWAYLTWAEPSFPEATQAGAGAAVPGGSIDPNPWTVVTDDIGLSIAAEEISMPGPGKFVATVASEWDNNATGQRYLGMYASNSDDAVMQEAHTHPSRRMFQNCTLVEKVEAGDNGLVVEVGQFGYLGSIGVTVSLTILYWAD